MKLHRPLVTALHDGLTDIFIHRKLADRVVENLLASQKKWGARDRHFVAENLYELVRWWRKVAFIAGVDYEKPSPNFWPILGTWFRMKGYPLPDWPELADVPTADQVAAKLAEAANIRAVRESVPDWLDSWGEQQFGSRWADELAALNQPAEVFIRPNLLRTSVAEVKKQLAAQGIDTEEVPEVPTALRLLSRKNLASNTLYKEGYFEIQDAGSQLIAPFLSVTPGSRVLDACAGAGGKTLQLANLLQNKGELVALDVEERKLKELQLRAKRNGAMGIKTRLASEQTLKEFDQWADFLLLDVPCSGLGVLRRNPDAKWRITPEFVEKIKAVQATILENYPRMLKPGGVVVYATCSIFAGENEEQVQRFLTTHPDFTLEDQRWLTPATHGFDGFYMARLRKG